MTKNGRSCAYVLLRMQRLKPGLSYAEPIDYTESHCQTRAHRFGKPVAVAGRRRFAEPKKEKDLANTDPRENLMPIRVTEIENGGSGATGLGAELNHTNTEGDKIALMVEGSLYRRDAELLERICRDLASQTKKGIMLDLSNLSFLDSDSAAILCLLKRELGVSLEGLHLFIEKVVELAEESEKVEKYRPRTVNVGGSGSV